MRFVTRTALRMFGTLLLADAGVASELLTASDSGEKSECPRDQVTHKIMRERHCFLQATQAVHRNSSNVDAPDLREIDTIKRSYTRVQSAPVTRQDKQEATVEGAQSTSEFLSLDVSRRNCLDASAWLSEFVEQPSWRHYSQGDQDAVLASLFSESALGTTNRYFVEFGFPDQTFNTSYGNGRNLHENAGFSKFLLLDGFAENPKINLHKRFVTFANIVDVFDEFAVPLEPDYVSVDIDSCDLWLFFALTSKYRPRVMTVEYNSNYVLGDYTTMRCNNPETNAWHCANCNIYGASLSAIELAAQNRGYSLAYVTPGLDMFLIRQDLLCKGSAPPIKNFAAATNRPAHEPYKGSVPASELLMDFKAWVVSNVAASLHH